VKSDFRGTRGRLAIEQSAPPKLAARSANKKKAEKGKKKINGY